MFPTQLCWVCDNIKIEAIKKIEAIHSNNNDPKQTANKEYEKQDSFLEPVDEIEG